MCVAVHCMLVHYNKLHGKTATVCCTFYIILIFPMQQPSISKPQVTLSATFRLPISKQSTTTTVQSVPNLKSQLSSPLLQAVSAISPSPLSTPSLPSSSSSSSQQQSSFSGTQVQGLQSGELPSSGGGGVGGQGAAALLGSLGSSLAGGGDGSGSGSASTTTPVLSMPLLGKMQ